MRNCASSLPPPRWKDITWGGGPGLSFPPSHSLQTGGVAGGVHHRWKALMSNFKGTKWHMRAGWREDAATLHGCKQSHLAPPRSHAATSPPLAPKDHLRAAHLTTHRPASTSEQKRLILMTHSWGGKDKHTAKRTRRQDYRAPSPCFLGAAMVRCRLPSGPFITLPCAPPRSGEGTA